MSSYTFTDDDMMQPVYCIGCRQHIPKVVSNFGLGLCPTCLNAKQAAQQAQTNAQAAAAAQVQAAQQAKAQAVYAVATGLGICPAYRSTNIEQVVNRTTNGSRGSLQAAGCMMGMISLFCLWPLAIVGILLFLVGACQPASNVTGYSRICRYCGHRWLC